VKEIEMIEQQLRIVKLLILIRYLYELQKAQRLLALGFEAGEDEIRTIIKKRDR